MRFGVERDAVTFLLRPRRQRMVAKLRHCKLEHFIGNMGL